MTQRKRAIGIISVLMAINIFSFCSTNSNNSRNIRALELTASLGGSGSFLDTIDVIYLSTTIYNPTSDTIQFVSMTCSYENLFTTNAEDYKIQSRYDCYKNHPTLVTLPPKTKTDRYLMISRKSKEKNLDITELRVGMYYLKYKKGMAFDNLIKLYENKQSGDLIWSNELDLNRLYNVIY